MYVFVLYLRREDVILVILCNETDAPAPTLALWFSYTHGDGSYQLFLCLNSR